jgi:hypothetical protein
VPERRLHDTRHTNATLSLESGESVKEVSERLGHANIGITLDPYVHPGETTKRESANRFDAFLKEGRMGPATNRPLIPFGQQKTGGFPPVFRLECRSGDSAGAVLPGVDMCQEWRKYANMRSYRVCELL